MTQQVAVVTGASRGIGRAIAMSLATNGYRVCATARDQVALDDLQAAGVVDPIAADLTVDAEIERLAQHARQRYEEISALVHCAGTHHLGSVPRLPIENLDEMYRSNVRAPYVLTQALLPLLRNTQGMVIFVNSSTGRVASRNAGVFSITQHALRALADALRAEVNPSGIRVLSIFPGRTATGRVQRICEQEGIDYQPELLLQPEDIARTVVDALSLSASAEVTDISLRPSEKSY